MPKSIPVSAQERHARMCEARAAIGRLLHAEYVPMLTEPLPSELKHLIAQLVAREARREGPGDHSLEALSSMIV
jgi:hypothetical protein